MPPIPDREELSTLGTMRRTTDLPPGTVALQILQDGLVTTRVLPRAGDIVIGRSAECDVQISHASISRRHAVIRVSPSPLVEDLGSANGTRVGDRALRAGEPAPITTGSVIQVGSVTLVFHRAPPVGDAGATSTDSAGPLRTKSETRELVERVAASDLSVLLGGETGVGKEVTAELIHRLSPRAPYNLVRLNCAALSESLLASELFGHEKGAFSGADRTKAGLLEVAHRGTVLLDEVGELTPTLQAKLLRVLEERAVLRVGGLQPRSIDVRFISATNRDLHHEVEAGRFRADLYFRLDGFSIVIPPLRERRHEIPGLAQEFIGEASKKMGCLTPPRLSPAALGMLESWSWPGNIRELRNVMDRAVLLSGGETIGPEQLRAAKMGVGPKPASISSDPQAVTANVAPSAPFVPPSPQDLREQLVQAERERLMATLAQCAGNQTQAAKLLGISRNTLAAQLERHGLPRPRKR